MSNSTPSHNENKAQYYSSSGRPLTQDYEDYVPRSTQEEESSFQIPRHWHVLPVLLLEFLALALTRAVLPGLLVQTYGSQHVYIILGVADFVRGSLAFLASPLVGQLSDVVGKRTPFLAISVAITCAPVCSLAFWNWQPQQQQQPQPYDIVTTTNTQIPEHGMTVFVCLLAMSGLGTSTFPLVFSYISDVVPKQSERVSAYGLALATFGLSFTLGPLLGGYYLQSDASHGGNPRRIFQASLVLTLLDLLYITLVLPESLSSSTMDDNTSRNPVAEDTTSVMTSTSTSTTAVIVWETVIAWKPLEFIQTTLWEDPFLRTVGFVSLLYYTGLWAVISTLSLYAVTHFHLTPQTLGELMSALGACHMLAEAILVRWLVPYWGEVTAIRYGLLSFALQCFLLAVASQPWHLFLCVACSLLGNLVYPSLSSLVTLTVEPSKIGTALGALNGVKALTEGIGPLVFGGFMAISETSRLPGWPYALAGLLVLGAYQVATEALAPYAQDDYIHELEFKQRRQGRRRGIRLWWRKEPQSKRPPKEAGDSTLSSSSCLSTVPPPQPPTRDEEEEEYQNLLVPDEKEETVDNN